MVPVWGVHSNRGTKGDQAPNADEALTVEERAIPEPLMASYF